MDGQVIHQAVPAQAVLIAPGAFLDLNFLLEHAVKLPARIYLGHDLIAEVIE